MTEDSQEIEITSDGDLTINSSQFEAEGNVSLKLQDLCITETDIYKLDHKSRSESMLKLDDERFQPDGSKKNQFAFTTTRPFVWFEGLKKYVTDHHLNTRCQKNERNYGKVKKTSIIKIHLTFECSKEMHISVNFNKGTITIKGACCSHWIANEFPKLQTFVPKRVPENPTVSPESINVEVPDEVPDEQKRQSDEDPKVGAVTKNLQEEVKELWANILANKTAFRTIEESIESISTRIKSNADASEMKFKDLENSIKDLDKKLDDKVLTYHQQNTNLLEKRCDKLTTDLNNKILSVKQVQTKFIDTVSQRVDEINHPDPYPNIEMIIKELKTKVENINLPQLEKDLSKTTDSLEDELKAIRLSMSTFQQQYKQQNENVDDSFVKIRNDIRKLTMSLNTKSAMNSVNCGSSDPISALQSDVNDIRSTVAELTVPTIETTREDSAVKDINHRITIFQNEYARQVESFNQATEEFRHFMLKKSEISHDSCDAEKNLTAAAPLAPDVLSTLLHHQQRSSANNQPHDRLSEAISERQSFTQDPTNESTANNITPPPTTPISKVIDETSELVLVFDSNARYIDFKKLWTIKTTDIQRKGTLKDVNDLLDKKEYRNLKFFFISVGCNDVDYKDGPGVFHDIKKTVQRIQSEYPNVKVIVSEITPRMDDDDIDKEVRDCNKLLNEFVAASETTFITRNSNLRDRRFFLPDGKHLRLESIAKFASNIKWALRRAYGIRWTPDSTFPSNSPQNPRQNLQRHNVRRNVGSEWIDRHNRYLNSDLPRTWGPVPMPSRDEMIHLLQQLANK